MLKMETPEGEVGCVVPLHRELAVGTLRGLLKQVKVNPDEFMENLYVGVSAFRLPDAGDGCGGPSSRRRFASCAQDIMRYNVGN